MNGIHSGGPALLVLVALVAAGCGGGSGTSYGGGGGTPQVNASTRSALPGGAISFTASQPVTWSVRELSGGSITPDGVYTAPPITGTFHIVATSAVDQTKSTTSAVTVAIDAPNGLTARALADADYLGYPRGATLVRWPNMSSRAVAYLVYRTSQMAPIAVVDGTQTWYRDSASALPQLTDVVEAVKTHIAIDTTTGLLTSRTSTVTYEPNANQVNTVDLALREESFAITARRMPLQAGQSCSYQVQVLYLEYDQNAISDPLGHPIAYRLRLGNKGTATGAVTLLPPPDLQHPSDPTSLLQGEFRCDPLADATSYLLQVSSSPTFAPDVTLTVPATAQVGSVLGLIDPMTLWQTFHATGAVPLFWRMGARRAGQPFPGSAAYTNCDAWVFSFYSAFSLPPAPPTGP